MTVPQFVYKFIYQKHVNKVLRILNKLVSFIIPSILKLPPSHQIFLNTNAGKVILKTNQTSYLTQVLYWKGYKSFEYSGIFEKLACEVNNFLDIGANIGYYSLLAAKANKDMRVFAFEPAIGPKYYLNENIKINGFEKNITPVPQAISNKTGDIDFYEVANKKYTYLRYNLAGEGNAGTKKTSRNFIKNTVSAITFKDFIATYQINRIDLIKIDTEGTEHEILKSGKKEIEKYQPIVICETLFNTIEDELEAFFTELNYDFYNHTTTGLLKVRSIKRSKDDGIRNCFFVPKSKRSLIEQFIVTN